MLKVIWQMLLGFVLINGGFYLAFMYIKGDPQGFGQILILGVIIPIAAGIFFILQAAKADDNVVSRRDKSIKGIVLPDSETLSKILDKNAGIISQWAKTNETKDKLKMMQTAAKEQEKPAGQ